MNHTITTDADTALAQSVVARLEDHLALVITDAARRVIHVSPAFCRLIGLVPEALLGQPLEVHFPKVRRELVSAHDAVRAGDARAVGEWRVMTSDGRNLDLRLTLERFDWPRGSVLVVAETIKGGREEVLDLIARGGPLEESLGRLMCSLEAERPQARCAVALRDGRVFRGAGAWAHGWLEGWLAEAPLGDPGASDTDSTWPSYLEIEDAPEGARRACWSVPIHSSGGLLLGAALSIEPFDEPDGGELRALESVARLAAIALEWHQLGHRIEHQANHDAVTGLPNRRLLDVQLRRTITQARVEDAMVAVALVDVGELKLINETLGHAAGDLLLRLVAERLGTVICASDVLARIGGNEFAVVMTGLESVEEAEARAWALLAGLEGQFRIWDRDVFVSASLGVSLFPRDGHDPTSLRGAAESALGRAKQTGRNTVQLFAPDMGSDALERLRLHTDLRQALERGELSVVYQPQFDLLNGKLVGLEALMRWNHPELGPIPPSSFIPIAEAHGLIFSFWTWMLNEVCEQILTWRREGFEGVRVALNVSATQFAREDFADSVTCALAASGLGAEHLELELTESLLMRDVEVSIRQMDRLRRAGISMAMDDFGTGHSSLSYLLRIPINTIKIDRSFVQALEVQPVTGSAAQPGGSSAEARSLFTAIIGLARSFGLRTVAEGIETPEELEILRELGCDVGQGYLFARPVRGHELEVHFQSGSMSPVRAALENTVPDGVVQPDGRS